MATEAGTLFHAAGMNLASDAARRRAANGKQLPHTQEQRKNKESPTVARLCSGAGSYDLQSYRPEFKVALNLIKKWEGISERGCVTLEMNSAKNSRMCRASGQMS